MDVTETRTYKGEIRALDSKARRDYYGVTLPAEVREFGFREGDTVTMGLAVEPSGDARAPFLTIAKDDDGRHEMQIRKYKRSNQLEVAFPAALTPPDGGGFDVEAGDPVVLELYRTGTPAGSPHLETTEIRQYSDLIEAMEGGTPPQEETGRYVFELYIVDDVQRAATETDHIRVYREADYPHREQQLDEQYTEFLGWSAVPAAGGSPRQIDAAADKPIGEKFRTADLAFRIEHQGHEEYFDLNSRLRERVQEYDSDGQRVQIIPFDGGNRRIIKEIDVESSKVYILGPPDFEALKDTGEILHRTPYLLEILWESELTEGSERIYEEYFSPSCRLELPTIPGVFRINTEVIKDTRFDPSDDAHFGIDGSVGGGTLVAKLDEDERRSIQDGVIVETHDGKDWTAQDILLDEGWFSLFFDLCPDTGDYRVYVPSPWSVRISGHWIAYFSYMVMDPQMLALEVYGREFQDLGLSFDQFYDEYWVGPEFDFLNVRGQGEN